MLRLLPLSLLALAACGPGTVYVTLAAQNNSGQSGMAELMQKGGRVVVQVSVKALPGVPNQAFHLHPGRCSEMGAHGFRLSGSGNCTTEDFKSGACTQTGSSVANTGELAEGLLEMPGRKLSDFTGGGWCINVHHPDDPLLYTSCGNID